MSDYAVHRCHLFEYTPKSIQCMASYELPDIGPRILAIGRENGAIELMKCTKFGFYTYLVIPGSSERHLEGLLFCDGRLFSAELQGVITEYDVTKGIAKYSEDCYGGAVWCLCAGNGNKKIAAGCEDGSLKIFQVSSQKIMFEKTLDKQEGRILSCSFHPNNEILVSGSVDVIRIWSYQSGHAVRRIRLDSAKRLDNIVWAVKILSDHTVISGDSMGKVSFWNGKTATLLQSFQNHRAGVLSLCVSEDESVVYSGGIDPRVIAIHRSESEDDTLQTRHNVVGMETAPEKISTWIKGAALQSHTHDIRAMALVGDFLASGGVDTNVLLHNIKKTKGKMQKKISPFPHHSIVHFAPISRTVVLQYPMHLDIWRLGTPESISGQVGETVQLLEEPTKLFQINLPKGYSDEISSSDISHCGHWVAYATKVAFKLFWLTWGSTDPTDLSVTKAPTRWVKSASAIAFTPDSKHLIVSSVTGKFYIMKLDENGHVHFEHIIDCDDGNSLNSLPVLLATNDQYFASLDLNNNINVYFVTKPELKCMLPRCSTIPTALAFRPSSAYLIVVYQDYSLVEYCVESKSYTSWCKKALAASLNLIEFPAKYSKRTRKVLSWNTSPILQISFSGIEPDKIMLSSHKNVFILKLSEGILEEIVRAEEEHSKALACGSVKDWKFREKLECPVKKIDAFDHLLHASFIDAGTSVIAVEKAWRDIFDTFPPTLYQRKYGT